MKIRTRIIVGIIVVAVAAAAIITILLPIRQRQSLADQQAAVEHPGLSGASAPPVAAASRQSQTPGSAASGNQQGEDQLKSLAAPLIAKRDQPTQRLIQKLLKGSSDQRTDALQELGFLDDPQIEPLIVHILLHDPDPAIRAAAAASLGMSTTSRTAPTALVQALEDPDVNVREDALLSLKVFRDSTVERGLRVLLANGHLAPDTATEVKLFLDRYYVHKDPFTHPFAE